MRTLYLSILFLVATLLPSLVKSQAHLGSTLDDIKKMHPDKEFKIDTSENGYTYASTKMDLGTFLYYFDEKGYSELCMQLPLDNQSMNRQIEIYNKNYVSVNHSEWTGYLTNGEVMSIHLKYSEDNKMYVFIYTPAKQ